MLAVDQGRSHADSLGVGRVDLERERTGFRASRGAAAEGTRHRQRDHGSSAEDPESQHVAPVRHVHTSWLTPLGWNQIPRWMHNQPRWLHGQWPKGEFLCLIVQTRPHA